MKAPLSFRNNGKDSKISIGSFLVWQHNREHVCDRIETALFLSAVTPSGLIWRFCLTVTMLADGSGHTADATSHEEREEFEDLLDYRSYCHELT